MKDLGDAFERLKKAGQLVDENALNRQRDIVRNMQMTPSVVETWGSPNIYKHIMEQIQEAEQELNFEYELGISLQLSGEWQNVLIDEIIALPPNLIVFKGEMGTTGESVRLVQHIQQVNLLLIKVKRLEPQAPKRKIGFSFP